MFQKRNPKCEMCETKRRMTKIVINTPNGRKKYFKCHECGCTFIEGKWRDPICQS